MKSAVDWFKEKGVPFDGDITIADIIEIQQDARDTALVDAANKFVKDGNPECFRDQILALRTKPTTNEQGFGK